MAKTDPVSKFCWESVRVFLNETHKGELDKIVKNIHKDSWKISEWIRINQMNRVAHYAGLIVQCLAEHDRKNCIEYFAQAYGYNELNLAHQINPSPFSDKDLKIIGWLGQLKAYKVVTEFLLTGYK